MDNFLKRTPFDIFLDSARLQGTYKPEYMEKMNFSQYQGGPWKIGFRRARYDSEIAGYRYTRSGIRLGQVEYKAFCMQLPEIILSLQKSHSNLKPFEIDLMVTCSKNVFRQHKASGDIMKMVEHVQEAMSEQTNFEMKNVYIHEFTKECSRRPSHYEVRSFFISQIETVKAMTIAEAARYLAKKKISDNVPENERNLGLQSMAANAASSDPFARPNSERAASTSGAGYNIIADPPKLRFGSVFSRTNQGNTQTEPSREERSSPESDENDDDNTGLSSNASNAARDGNSSCAAGFVHSSRNEKGEKRKRPPSSSPEWGDDDHEYYRAAEEETSAKSSNARKNKGRKKGTGATAAAAAAATKRSKGKKSTATAAEKADAVARLVSKGRAAVRRSGKRGGRSGTVATRAAAAAAAADIVNETSDVQDTTQSDEDDNSAAKAVISNEDNDFQLRGNASDDDDIQEIGMPDGCSQEEEEEEEANDERHEDNSQGHEEEPTSQEMHVDEQQPSASKRPYINFS